jgi:hypothetical protein
MISNIISWDYFMSASIQMVFTVFRYGFNTYNFVSKKLKKKLVNHTSLKNVKSYPSFEVHTYEIVKDEHSYLFDFIVKNNHKNNTKLINTLVDDAYNNAIDKEDNKNKILHVSLMNSNEDILCEICEELRKFKYYFDCYKEYNCENNKEEYESVHHLYWKDILEIISTKYKKHIDPNTVFIYTILNDDTLSESTVLLSSILDRKIHF